MHDYDPSWDHDVLATPEDAAVPLERALAIVATDMLPALELSAPRVFFAELGGPLGIYVDGTSTAPVIGIDHETLKTACMVFDLDYAQQLSATIAHEMAMAYQESLGLEVRSTDAAERFARRWTEHRQADTRLLQPSAPAPC